MYFIYKKILDTIAHLEIQWKIMLISPKYLKKKKESFLEVVKGIFSAFFAFLSVTCFYVTNSY